MAKRKAVNPTTEMNLNMTPMIDCTFQLIIFFVVCTQAASDAYATVQLSKPLNSMAVKAEEDKVPNSMIVNVVSQDAQAENPDKMVGARASRYEIQKEPFDVGDTQKLAERIKTAYTDAKARGDVVEGDPLKEFYVEIRGDKRLNYEDVSPVIKSAVMAGVSKMKLTALID